MFFFVFVRPAWQVMMARSWTQRPCRIVSSQVRRHSGKNGPTYSVDIVFTYHVNGQGFTSSRYQFLGGSSSGYAGKEEIVERYPPGSQRLCYVNPANPADAVIERSFTRDMLFGLIPLLFAGVGAGGLVFGRKLGTPATGATLWAPAAIPASGVTMWGGVVKRQAGDIGLVSVDPRELRHEKTSVEMQPPETPGGNVAKGLLFSSLFLGGLFLALRNQVPRWEAGQVDGMAMFVVILGLFSLLMVVGTIRAFMQSFDPRVHLRLTPGTLRLGRDFSVAWESQGGRKRLAQLRITIECREHADFPTQKGSGTASSLCYRADLVNTQKPEEMAAGSITMKAPEGVMHSLNTGRNRIAWKMRVEGRVPYWVGIKDEYPVVILPEGWKETA